MNPQPFKAKPPGKTYQIGTLQVQPEQQYVRAYTYSYTWLKRPEVLLHRLEISPTNFLELYDQKLVVYKNHSYYYFPLGSLQAIGLRFKYYVMPMIVGGIVAPMSIVALTNGMMQAWAGFIMLLSGILLFYYGSKGGHQVYVSSHQTEVTFFVEENTNALKAFMEGVNRRAGKNFQ